MLFGLDYDGTYSKDPEVFDKIIKVLINAGHRVVCITMRRSPEERIEIPGIEIIYTARRAKVSFARENNIPIDIWIDDKPQWLFNDG